MPEMSGFGSSSYDAPREQLVENWQGILLAVLYESVQRVNR